MRQFLTRIIKNDRIFDYANLILAGFLIAVLMRIVETSMIAYNYGLDSLTLFSELIGLACDILFAGALFVVFFPVYFFTEPYNKKIIKLLFILIAGVLCTIHFVILKYFLYQLIPLDIFLYQYSVKEILYTLKTSDTNMPANLLLLAFIISFIIITVNFVVKYSLNIKIKKGLLIIIIFSLPLYILLHIFFNGSLNKYSQNKTVFFFTESFKFFNETEKRDAYSFDYLESFRDLYPSKEFIDSEYPLLYKPELNNSLGQYFEKFDCPPNIVILIVEGLNDDFIHDYEGALFMPFLNSLKDSSLYWDKCLTVGERSFAVVPSVLGGLPYGQKGFTLLEKLPRHLSLVSFLNSNNYHSSFFYGQARWFHQKSRFFDYNDIDLIFDNSRYSQKYSKIIVGDDNFFWGYNDKDMFNQSFEVIDTLVRSRRLDIYFTGTSHSPFMIDDEEYYSSKLKSVIPEGREDFFVPYSKYWKSVLFVDDALKNFFDKYRSLKEYENTIFIITGDHPMTEIPIANSLKRYHVPLIIFSDKLHKYKTFNNVVSHLDIYGTLISFLKDYLEVLPTVSTSLGDNLIPGDNPCPKRIAFMNDNREIIDYYSDGYFLSDDVLYKVDSDFAIKRIRNKSQKSSLRHELNTFKTVNLYTCLNDKIISNDRYLKELNRLNLYSYESSDTITIDSEYYSLTKRDIIIPDAELRFDISFKYKTLSSENLSVVYSITNPEGDNILWKNFGTDKGESMFQEHVKIDKQLVNDSVLYFSSYIWNQNRIEMNISDVKLLLYSAESKNQTE